MSTLQMIKIPVVLFSAIMAGATCLSDDRAYMIIELSSGPGEISYPVTYLSDVPAGGWTDTFKTTKLVLRKIPAGTFTMGSPISEHGRGTNETQHLVTLTKAFYIGVFEVTQRQWELVMGNSPSRKESAYASRPVDQVSYYDIRENPANCHDPSVDWPNNSQVNAASFMGKLRATTGLSTFDLPTESQWEYACRAGTTTGLNNGYDLTNTISDKRLDQVARYRSNCEQAWFPSLTGTKISSAKVGSYLPNAWGLYDMHGNVWEWCLDWYGWWIPSRGVRRDPGGEVLGEQRSLRGGNFYSEAVHCRAACNIALEPDSRNFLTGFRLAMTLP